MRTPILATTFGAALGLGLAAGAALADDRPDIVIAVEGLFRTMEPIDGNSTTGGRVHPNIYDMIVARNYLDDPEGDRDWGISATIDLAESDEIGEAAVTVTSVGPA